MMSDSGGWGLRIFRDPNSVFFSQSVTFEEHFWLSKRTLFGPLLERFGPPVDARYEKCSFWSVWTSGGCTLSSVLASGGCTLYKNYNKFLFPSLLRLRRSRKFCAPPRVIHFFLWQFLLIRSYKKDTEIWSFWNSLKSQNVHLLDDF